MDLLTDDEIRAIQARHPTDNNPMDFARAIIAATVAKLAAEVEALRVDAGRYRWLRSTTNFVTSSRGEKIDVRNCPDEWDEAIDRAIAMKGELK